MGARTLRNYDVEALSEDRDGGDVPDDATGVPAIEELLACGVPQHMLDDSKPSVDPTGAKHVVQRDTSITRLVLWLMDHGARVV